MDGILPLLKPKGMTSHDCVFKLRKILKTKKIGHTGTLDPDVTGVLPICIGKATKIAEYMTEYPKTYEAKVTLGFSTTTEDASGDIVEKKEVVTTPSLEEIVTLLKDFTGKIEQVPPMYSAVKVNGKKLYQYAREGKVVERPKRNVHIYELSLLSIDTEIINGTFSFHFKVSCSKGTYIRTLAVDIGAAMEYPAHMSYLIRTASGPFSIDQCVSLEQVEEIVLEGKIKSLLLPIEEALKHFPKVIVNNQTAARIKNGSVLAAFEGVDETRFTVYNEDGICLAVYQQHPTKKGLIKPEKMLFID